MVSIRVPKGFLKDVPFNTKIQPNGALCDPFNWTNGLTHAQWPTVRFYTAPNGGGTEVTSQVVHDITSETIVSASHKDPTGTTGVWRKSTGQYRVRVQPQNSLSLGVYYMFVQHEPTSGNPYPEDHEFEVIATGDTTFSDVVFDSVTVDDIRALIQTSLTDEQLEPILAEAVVAAEGFLEDVCGVDPDELEELPKSVRTAILAYALGLVQIYDGSASGLDTATEIREGSEVIKFGNRITSDNYVSNFEMWMARYCRGRRAAMGPMFVASVRDVGHSVN